MLSETAWTKTSTPFHRGEQELHGRLGIVERMRDIGKRMLRPYMTEQHRDFFESLPFVAVGSVDSSGAPWASMIFGLPGFFESTTETRARIRSMPLEGDPLINTLKPGAPISIVGIDLSSRRRNRINLTVRSVLDNEFSVSVDVAFGNCPRYIHTRDHIFIRDPERLAKPNKNTLTSIDSVVASFIKKADTFFVASHNPMDSQHETGGVDINHRGGKPGFIKVDGNTLTIPDYAGNNAFNTLGNFIVNPKAGLMFVDYNTGNILQMTGRTEVLWDETPEVKAFEGAKRVWRFTFTEGHILKAAAPIKWTLDECFPI